MKRILTPLIVGLVLIGAAGAGARAYFADRTPATHVTTAPVTIGSVVDEVAATGTVQAVTTVQVGTQVSGTIAWLGADFNSLVKAGQVIARLEPSLFQAQLEQAKANVTRAQADADRAKVQLDDAQQKFARAQELATRQLLSQSDFDAAKVAVDSAVAQVHGADAQVIQARASLNQSEVNLAQTVIVTPITGMVIERSVDIGQTVAASLQSPTIFKIAADLSQMQVNASIDESDIGRVGQGQTVLFSVDAYPHEEFSGVVTQVRLQPTVAQNVTTYSVIINASNADLKLKPGMTANLRIEVARRDQVVRVSNAALRFRPTAAMLADDEEGAVDLRGSGRGHSVWMETDGALKEIPVNPGITDGVNTELVGASLAAGTELVTAVATGDVAVRPAATTNNPFMGMQSQPRR